MNEKLLQFLHFLARGDCICNFGTILIWSLFCRIFAKLQNCDHFQPITLTAYHMQKVNRNCKNLNYFLSSILCGINSWKSWRKSCFKFGKCERCAIGTRDTVLKRCWRYNEDIDQSDLIESSKITSVPRKHEGQHSWRRRKFIMLKYCT